MIEFIDQNFTKNPFLNHNLLEQNKRTQFFFNYQFMQTAFQEMLNYFLIDKSDIYATPLHTTDQTLGMDLKEQLEVSIRNMEGEKYKGAKKLFEEVVKVLESSQPLSDAITNDTVATAYNWVEELKHSWWNAKKDKALRSLLLNEFGTPEWKLNEYREFTSWFDKTKDLLEKISETKRDLKEKQKKEDAFIYKPEYSADDTTLEGYVDIGTYLTSETSVVIKEMTELTETTYKNIINNPSDIPPSFIVCSSSGTGKTQLPFSLEIPLLYFCCEYTGCDQKIYQVFEKVSKYFMKLLDSDFSTYIEALAKDPESISRFLGISSEQIMENSSSENDDIQSLQIADAKQSVKDQICRKIAKYSLNCFTFDCLKEVTCEYRTLFFLIQLIEKIIALEEKNKKSTAGNYSPTIWPKLQLSLNEDDKFTLGKLDIKKSRMELRKIYSDVLKRDPKFNLPLIFLDEFNVSTNKNPESTARYAFYRNIIRACGLIPVLTGTNSQITNVITAGTASGKEAIIWAHIFYKLPEYPRELFEKNVANVDGLSPSGRDMLIHLFPLLHQERPLFVQSIFKKIDYDLKELNAKSKSIISWLKYIISKFRTAFSVRKIDDMSDFHNHQIQFFINSYYRSFNKGKDLPPYPIHSYLAYLTPPEDIHPKCEKSYFDVYQLGKKVKYYRMVNGSRGYSNYKPNARFPKFKKQLLTCMAFSQNNTEDSCSFKKSCPSEDTPEFFTTFQALTDIQQSLYNSQSKRGVQYELNGSILEQIVSTAFMISSHTNFLTGMPFEEWFKYFIQQLACYSSNEFAVPEPITFDSKFKFKNFIVPYFAFDCANWPKVFVDLLPNNTCCLGTYSGAFRESRDLSATTELYKGDFGFKSKKLKISKRKQDSKNEQDLVDEGFPDDGQDSDNEKDIMEISSLGKFDKTEAGESEEMEYLQHNSNSNDQAVQMQPGTSKTRKRRGLSTNSSVLISPKSTEMLQKETGKKEIFSVECKLHESELYRSDIKKIIMKITSAGLHRIFNFIIAPSISDQIEFFFDPEYKVKEERIKQLKKQKKSPNLTNTMEQLTLNPDTVEDSTENIPDEVLDSEVKQLETQLEDKIPYDDISIFRLETKPKSTTAAEKSTTVEEKSATEAGKSTTEAGKSTTVDEKSTTAAEKLLLSSCHYTSSQSKLHLTPVYNCDIVPKAVFILIELTEIHGKEHLNDCLMYFKK